jgi:4'-phosphopantetheinyl transferase
MNHPAAKVFIGYTLIDKNAHDHLFDLYFQELPVVMRESISKFSRWQDAQASLLGKLLVNEMSEKLFGRRNILNDVQYNAFGKPFAEYPDFNISHAADLVVCAMSTACKTGIDIEKVQPVDIGQFTAVMSEDEWADIADAADPVTAFFSYWTCKESIVKANGKGLSTDLRSFVVADKKATLDGVLWHCNQIDLLTGYHCVVATDLDIPENEILKQKISFLPDLYAATVNTQG